MVRTWVDDWWNEPYLLVFRIAPLVFAILIGAANMAIYYATIDYMVAAYGGKYAASATGGNGL